MRAYGRIRLTRIGEALVNGAMREDGTRWGHESAVGEVRDCNKLNKGSRRLDHKGWFMDHFQEDTVLGVVVTVRIPRRRAKSEGLEADGSGFTRIRYVPGYRTSYDGFCMARTTMDDLMDAGYAADTLAECGATECRDASVKDMVAQELSAIKEQIAELRGKVSRLIQALRSTIAAAKALMNGEPCAASDDAPVMVSAAREVVNKHLSEIGRLRERHAKLADNNDLILEKF